MDLTRFPSPVRAVCSGANLCITRQLKQEPVLVYLFRVSLVTYLFGGVSLYVFKWDKAVPSVLTECFEFLENLKKKYIY